MTDEQRDEIADLAEKAYFAEERYRALGMRNIAPLTPDERRKSAVEYALAHAEMVEALAARDAAIIALGKK